MHEHTWLAFVLSCHFLIFAGHSSCEVRSLLLTSQYLLIPPFAEIPLTQDRDPRRSNLASAKSTSDCYRSPFIHELLLRYEDNPDGFRCPPYRYLQAPVKKTKTGLSIEGATLLNERDIDKGGREQSYEESYMGEDSFENPQLEVCFTIRHR
ncbi:hypothetical protein PAE9249_04541 [Paenibacillus sp. CECT 9249]|nr:hypothetical protein PAE9249_04541 [Paenibacillus sp. CECT 9249]